MKTLITQLKTDYPDLKYSAGEQFSWSPETKEIFFVADSDDARARWSLLHETGHALLGHNNYGADFELLKLEVEAWEKAKELAKKYAIKIDFHHVEDCLDTYRDWLHKRSLCPTCSNQCLQEDDHAHYRCFNCQTRWKVSKNRFCRSYRRAQDVPRK